MEYDREITILLADDHKILRHGLKQAIDNEEDMQVIAEARDGRTALKLTLEKNPDVIIMDVSMPDLNGMEASRQILAEHPDVKIIALSMHSERHYIMGMLKAGVSGYILKTNAFDELAAAVRSVTTGKAYLSREITGLVIESAVKVNSGTPVTDSEKLSSREIEVLQLIAEGKTTAYMADHLNISRKTVETHRQNLKKKLNLKSIAELTKFAIKEGITSL